jgi:hypothetical protein
MLEIDPDDDQYRRAEEKISGRRYAQPKPMNDGCGQEGHAQFNRWVLEGDSFLTVAATAPQDEIAENGNVLIPRKGMQAAGAVRGGKDNGAILGGKPENDDIEEAADNGPKEHGKQERES